MRNYDAQSVESKRLHFFPLRAPAFLAALAAGFLALVAFLGAAFLATFLMAFLAGALAALALGAAIGKKTSQILFWKSTTLVEILNYYPPATSDLFILKCTKRRSFSRASTQRIATCLATRSHEAVGA